MCACSSDRPQFLLAGDSSDIPFIQATLRRTPVDAYGQVYIEVATSLQIRRIDEPHGVTVTWLCRDQAGIDRPMEPRGQRLSRAVRGWFAEWTCGENDPATKVVWLGATTCPQVEDLHQELRERYPVLQHGPSASFRLGGEEV